MVLVAALVGVELVAALVAAMVAVELVAALVAAARVAVVQVAALVPVVAPLHSEATVERNGLAGGGAAVRTIGVPLTQRTVHSDNFQLIFFFDMAIITGTRRTRGVYLHSEEKFHVYVYIYVYICMYIQHSTYGPAPM